MAKFHGESSMLLPPTIAADASPQAKALHAVCKATMDEEHAVLMTMLIKPGLVPCFFHAAIN